MIELLEVNCSARELSLLLSAAKRVLSLIQIIGPILLIISITISLVKLISKPDDKKLPKNIKNSVIALVLIFFIPVLINSVMRMLGNNFTVSACWNSISETEGDATYIEPGEPKKGVIPDPGKYGTGSQMPTTGGAKLSKEQFESKLSKMKTPSKAEIEKVAKEVGLTSDYTKIVVGTSAREGYKDDPYLYYGWASAMINRPTTIEAMQGWDPSSSGDANYYSWANINKGYNSANDTVLKAVYLALTNRNTKIVECNGMYNSTPASYNLLYKSSRYNCSIYEKK